MELTENPRENLRAGRRGDGQALALHDHHDGFTDR
jgi:hypothetical protein